MTENRASWHEWLSAYTRAYDALPASNADVCPNCASAALHLAFTGLPRDRVGYASFWCSACQFGIHLSRVPVPDDVPMDSVYTPAHDRSAHIPNYTVVAQDAEDDGDDDDVESFQF
ncbi:hypothetical protein [Streptomyces sp. NBC_01477]|uniref:hypothetical protein n=1 Tax=Streptomyces sp. NBC_01477 TaxID=2976015 RepID=UPI002E32BFF3|nr:hypothetical protein [Streptomyces sp. NBC_01477]